uniref:Uncharacterized protein n=1 Tax=viral metagenome TaxID=1070528 RepID=A0A6M3KDC3_9ZZZZ
MTSQRMLRKWRQEALVTRAHIQTHPADPISIEALILTQNEKILILTQELMDINLLKENKNGVK